MWGSPFWSPPSQSCLGWRGRSGSYQQSRGARHSERMPLSQPCAPILPWSLWLVLESTRFGTSDGPTRLLLLSLSRSSYGKEGKPCAAERVVVADMASRESPTTPEVQI